jgi:hypothetical protein
MALDTNLDPNTLFNRLVKEARENNAPAAETNTDGGTGDPAPTTPEKTAADANAPVFDKAFFDSVKAGDAGAETRLNDFVKKAMEEGHTPDEIAQTISELEAEANAPATDTPAGDPPPAATNEGEPSNPEASVDTEFEAAQAKAVDEAVNKALDDELSNNEMAKAAGIDRKMLNEFLIHEAAGEHYFHARKEAAAIVGEIVSRTLPDDELIAAAVKVAKDAGLDVTKIETELTELTKEASAAPAESDIVKKAREVAEAEQALHDSLIVLKEAGFDVEALAKEAEEKKKMSGKKKAGIALGTLATVGAGVAAVKNRGAIAGAVNKAKTSYRAAKQKKMFPGTKID